MPGFNNIVSKYISLKYIKSSFQIKTESDPKYLTPTLYKQFFAGIKNVSLFFYCFSSIPTERISVD